MGIDSLDFNLIFKQIDDWSQCLLEIKNHLNYDQKILNLKQIESKLQSPEIWQDYVATKQLNEEKSTIVELIKPIDQLDEKLEEVKLFLEIVQEENNEKALQNLLVDLEYLGQKIAKLQFNRLFSGKMDEKNAYLDIQAGSGGTEAQDWAEMLFRMYLKFLDQKGFSYEIIEISGGDVAGIKSASIFVKAQYAYGWLKTELGIHRLVRKSPFDSNHKRHTSFASVFVSPEVDDNILIQINPADLRIDTYRASGAGGQHVNKTDSAVRITHLPTKIVVQCQNGRSQHANKETAMKQLKASLYELEMQKQRAEKNKLEESKSDVGWGSQIRSYVLDQSRIKDLRTGFESSNPQAVLDGDLEAFIEESLKQGVGV